MKRRVRTESGEAPRVARRGEGAPEATGPTALGLTFRPTDACDHVRPTHST